MRTLDPRLVARTRAARPLLVADAAMGIATTVPVIVQATVLAGVVTRAFGRDPSARLGAAAAALVAAFAVRGALAWGMEVAGRRAAASVLSELRLDLARRRLRTQPLATDGVQSGEVVAASVQGIEALEAYFGRYLPQAVLATVVPVVVLGFVATVDLTSALIMLLTLPLVPVFMWLIGRYTEQRTREQWSALRTLSTHFLDVVRGLPTLRAFGRARVQQTTIAEVGEAHRRATMATLRVAFLSGSVLELAATLGVALVAVTVGVRLAGGDMALGPGLTVLVLVPELYLPIRRLGAEFHASAAGLAVAERMLALLEAPAASVDRAGAAPPSPAVAAVRFEGVGYRYPARPAPVLDRLDLDLRPGETVALVGESGAGKSTVAALLLGLLAPDEGRITVGGTDLAACDSRAWRRMVAWVPQRPALVRGTVAENIRLGAPGGLGRGGPGGRGARGRGRFRRGAARRLRHGDRRRRPRALGRRAPPHRPRARVPPRRSARHPRRADRRPRSGERRAGRGGDRAPARRPHGARDRRTARSSSATPTGSSCSRTGPPPRRTRGRRRDADPAPPARPRPRRARPGARVRRPRRADRAARRRAHGDGGMADRPRVGAAADPLAVDRDRRRAGLRDRAPARPLRRARRLPRPRAPIARRCPRAGLGAARAARARAARGLPPRRPPVTHGRRRRRAAEPPPPRRRAAARGAPRRRGGVGRRGRRPPCGGARPRGRAAGRRRDRPARLRRARPPRLPARGGGPRRAVGRARRRPRRGPGARRVRRGRGGTRAPARGRPHARATRAPRRLRGRAGRRAPARRDRRDRRGRARRRRPRRRDRRDLAGARGHARPPRPRRVRRGDAAPGGRPRPRGHRGRGPPRPRDRRSAGRRDRSARAVRRRPPGRSRSRSRT